MLHQYVKVSEVALEALSGSNRRGADNVIDQSAGFSTGFGRKRHRELDSDFERIRQRTATLLRLCVRLIGGAQECVSCSSYSRGSLANQELHQLLLLERCALVGGGLILTKFDGIID